MTRSRDAVLGDVARHLAGHRPGHPLRVGVDGVCGAGKSTFAAELVALLRARGREATRLDSDGFHHLRARRHRNDDPARGYYEDSYDFPKLAKRVLRPLGPNGDRRFATKIHDLVTDEIIGDEYAVAAPDAIVVFDATFLQSEVLGGLWDDVIYLDVDERVATERGVARDRDALGGEQAARDAYANRYMAACRLYVSERDPLSRASMVVDHTDPARPAIVRAPDRPGCR